MQITQNLPPEAGSEGVGELVTSLAFGIPQKYGVHSLSAKVRSSFPLELQEGPNLEYC